MNILSLEIVNNKAIRAFLLDANGKNIEIAGDTGTGKTTAISVLWDIFSKGKDIITRGESKSVQRVTVGDATATYYMAERITTPSKSTVNAWKMIGEKKLPMDLKDFEAMLSKLSVNPHKIADMKPKERIKALMAAADCDIDLDALDAQIEGAEQDRLLAGRAAKASKPVEVPEKIEAVSVSALVAERDVITAKNQKITDFESAVRGVKDDLTATQKRIDELKDEILKAEARSAELRDKAEKGDAWLMKNKVVATTDLDEQISNAEEINKRAAIYEQAVKDLENHNMLQAMHKESDEQVKALHETKKEALNSIKWPLEGLSVEDGAIIYNGDLFENLGESKQMLVCAAIAVGDIAKHEIKVARMDGVESMSKADYEALRNLFNEHKIQVLSTRVARGKVEEGEIEITEGSYNEA